MKSDLTNILTKREIETLIFINHFFNTKKRMPTHNELKDALNLHSNGFRHRILEKLKDLGYLKTRIKYQIPYEIELEGRNEGAKQSSIKATKARILRDYERE